MDKNKVEILKVTKSDQYKTVEELMKKSESNSIYYTLLILSGGIVSIGLILSKATIVIGGMLVTPILTPILVIALGISTGQLKAIKYSSITVAKSLIIILAISLLVAIFFGGPDDINAVAGFSDSTRTGILYFTVALISGVAATFAWARKETDSVLPGIAIAVSLVPPLSLLGIAFGVWNIDLARISFLIFISNFIGVILGSMIVFSLLKFYKTEDKIEKEIDRSEKKLVEIDKNKIK